MDNCIHACVRLWNQALVVYAVFYVTRAAAGCDIKIAGGGTYLLTYLLTYLHTYLTQGEAMVCIHARICLWNHVLV